MLWKKWCNMAHYISNQQTGRTLRSFLFTVYVASIEARKTLACATFVWNMTTCNVASVTLLDVCAFLVFPRSSCAAVRDNKQSPHAHV